MPKSAACCIVSSTSALRSMALVGIQPQLRHTPPRRSFSISATRSPYCAARIAALGAGVSTDSTGKPLAEGDRIIYNYFFPCGRCVACLRDQPEACPKKMRPGFKGRFGEPGVFPYFIAGFSEYYYLPPGHIC